MPWTDAVISGAVAAGIFLIGVAGFGWKARDWLATQFTDTRKAFHEKMEQHEDLDQKRHEENLERFANIRVELARAGKNNGEGRFHAS